MKTLRLFVSILLFTSVFAVIGNAQKKPVKRTTPVKNTSTMPPLEVRAARVKVSNQFSNVDQFVTIMGPIAQSIEALDDESRTKKVSQTSLDLNKTSKEKLLTAIKNMRAGIDSLETEFETKPALKMYLVRIQGISDLAAQSENLAFTGKFVAASEPWKQIRQKLNDTLTAMPNVEL
jgi:hypothetical protein